MKLSTLLNWNDALNASLHTLNSALNLWISISLLVHGLNSWGTVSFVFIGLNYVTNAVLFSLLIKDIRRARILPSYFYTPTPIVVLVGFVFGVVVPAVGLLLLLPLRRTSGATDLDELASNDAWRQWGSPTEAVEVKQNVEEKRQKPTLSQRYLSRAVEEELSGIDRSVSFVQKLRLLAESVFPQHLQFFVQTVLEGFPLFLIQLIALSRGILPGHLVPLVWVSMGSAIVSLLLKSYIGCQSLDPLVCLIRFLFIVYDVNAMIFTIVYMATVGAPGESVLTMAWLIFGGIVSSLVFGCIIGFNAVSMSQHSFLKFVALLLIFSVPLCCVAAFIKFLGASYVIQRLQPSVRWGGPQAATFAFLRQGDWNERLRFLLFTAAAKETSQSRELPDGSSGSAIPIATATLYSDYPRQKLHAEAVIEFRKDESLDHLSLANPFKSGHVDFFLTTQSTATLAEKFRVWIFRFFGIGIIVTAILFPWVTFVDVSFFRRQPDPAVLDVLRGSLILSALLLLSFVPLLPRLYKYVIFCLEYEQLEGWCRQQSVTGPWGKKGGDGILFIVATYFRPPSAAALRCCIGSGSLKSQTSSPINTDKGENRPGSEAVLLIPDDIVDRLSTFLSPDAIDVSGLSRTEVFQMKVSGEVF
jgi:hypothetical protein